MAFTMSERRKLLDEYFQLAQKVNNEAAESSGSSSSTSSDLANQNRNRLLEIVRLYEEGLPRLPLSRCPLTGEIVLHTFDPFGLDGLWWNYDAPVRPSFEHFVTCLAVTGAVALSGNVEKFPFLCKPGPAVPWVLPRLLNRQGVYAVIYQTPVGHHQSYAIMYFAAQCPDGLTMPNSWGTNTYWDDTDGNPGWYTSPDEPEEWDFNLRPWIQSGKVLWIAPGDSTMTLRTDIAECPYLNLPGERQLQRISRGKIWLDQDNLTLKEGP